MSDSETVVRDDAATGSPHETHEGHEVTHVTLRIVDLDDDGWRVTEPGVQESITRDDLHTAVADYAELTSDHSD